MERHLSKVYKRAGKELSEKHKEYFEKFNKADEKKRELVSRGLMSQSEYKKWRKGKIAMGKHWTAMKEQAAMDIHNVNKIATAYINDQIPDIYMLNYNYSAKDIEAGMSHKISFEMANQRAIQNLVLHDDHFFLPRKILDPKKDIPWNMKMINAEILQGIYQGESVKKMALRLMNVENMNYKSAIRSARTIVTTVENKAKDDSAKAAEKKGVILKKCWVTIGDHRTRDWHIQAGIDYGDVQKAIPIDEPFIVNGEKLMYPGDTSLGASPNNIYNCRCGRKNIPVGFKSILPEHLQGKIKVSFG